MSKEPLYIFALERDHYTGKQDADGNAIYEDTPVLLMLMYVPDAYESDNLVPGYIHADWHQYGNIAIEDIYTYDELKASGFTIIAECNSVEKLARALAEYYSVNAFPDIAKLIQEARF